MMRKVRAEGENRLKRLVNNVKRSTVWKLMFTVIVIFIGMTLLSNFITNIYVNDLIQDMDKEISKMVDASDESEMYLIINDSQIKSNMEFKIYIFCVVLFTVIIGCIVLYLVISKYVPLECIGFKSHYEHYYQITAIDLYSRKRILKLVNEHSSYETAKMLKKIGRAHV